MKLPWADSWTSYPDSDPIKQKGSPGTRANHNREGTKFGTHAGKEGW